MFVTCSEYRCRRQSVPRQQISSVSCDTPCLHDHSESTSDQSAQNTHKLLKCISYLLLSLTALLAGPSLILWFLIIFHWLGIVYRMFTALLLPGRYPLSLPVLRVNSVVCSRSRCFEMNIDSRLCLKSQRALSGHQCWLVSHTQISINPEH